MNTSYMLSALLLDVPAIILAIGLKLTNIATSATSATTVAMLPIRQHHDHL